MNAARESDFQSAQGAMLEGGVFYPVGCIVAGVQDHEQALRLRRLFEEAGWEDDECLLAEAKVVASDAAGEVAGQNIIAALGASAQVRDRQRQLARQGCDFLVVHAPSSQDRREVLDLLARVPVRYAVRYGRFAIEDLIDHIPSADRPEAARKVI